MQDKLLTLSGPNPPDRYRLQRDEAQSQVRGLETDVRILRTQLAELQDAWKSRLATFDATRTQLAEAVALLRESIKYSGCYVDAVDRRKAFLARVDGAESKCIACQGILDHADDCELDPDGGKAGA